MSITHNIRILIGVFLYLSLTIWLVQNYNFKDFSNYQDHVQTSLTNLIYYYDKGLLTLIFNDPLYKLMVGGFSFVNLDNPILILYGLNSIGLSYIILSRKNLNFFYICILLASPFLVRYQLVQVRHGLAMSIFTLAYFSNKNSIKYIFYTIAPLIHSVFFMVLPILLLHNIVNKFISSFIFRYIIIIGSISCLYFFAIIISSFLEMRASQRLAIEEPSVSGLLFLFWLAYLIYFIFSGNFTKLKFEIPIYFISIYLIIYFFLPFAGRFLGAILLIVTISLFELKLKPSNKFILVCFYSLHVLIDWYERSSLHGFGYLE